MPTLDPNGGTAALSGPLWHLLEANDDISDQVAVDDQALPRSMAPDVHSDIGGCVRGMGGRHFAISMNHGIDSVEADNLDLLADLLNGRGDSLNDPPGGAREVMRHAHVSSWSIAGVRERNLANPESSRPGRQVHAQEAKPLVKWVRRGDYSVEFPEPSERYAHASLLGGQLCH